VSFGTDMMDGGCSFFVTYNHRDEAWATWIARELEAAGYRVRIQAWDFRPGDNFMAMMDRALGQCRQTVGVLSPDYLGSAFATAEWTAAYRQALLGRERGFVPVRVAECDPAPLLGPLAYIDLVGQTEDEARRRLLDGLGPDVARQPSRPEFPGQPGR
jgi:hypothetical protein